MPRPGRGERRHRERRVGDRVYSQKPGGNADDYQNKGVAGNAIHNKMKKKDLQIDPKHEWALTL
jgi:hypothetical protein